MATETKVEVIQRETIKPSSPTPHHLRTHKLCLIDQFSPVMYFPLLLFYPHLVNRVANHEEQACNIAEKAQFLKKTLSQTLTHFYPLAGRITSSFASIECNDDGAEFVEARINLPMSTILEKPNIGLLRRFLAAEPESKEARRGPLLVVQATFFKCGGMAIGLCISHNAMDAASLTRFLSFWASTALGYSREMVTPEFSAASLLPPIDFSIYSDEPPAVELDQGKCITRRFVFEAAYIASLQSKAASESVKKPTRVEAVSALLWKSAMKASRSNTAGSFKPSVFCQIVNLRPRTVPPLAENLVGNLIVNIPAQVDDHSYANDLKILVAILRKVIEEVKEKYGTKGPDVEEVEQSLKKGANLLMHKGIESYCCSSWCRFPFYKVDFGWGEPAWVSSCGLGFKNFVFLMSTRNGDGIEAWFTLGQQDMELVERNHDLLAFAALNPSVF